MRKSILILLMVLGGHLSFASDQNEISKNVNTVDPGSKYQNDFDTSKFRIGVMQSSFDQGQSSQRDLASLSSISDALKASPASLCKTVKNFSAAGFNSSSAYVVSALKKAGAISQYDKDYSLKSASFLWELYLGYRKFVDLSKPLSAEGSFSKSMIPEGAIVNVEKGCNENGATAIFCGGSYYTNKFVDEEKLFNRVNDPSDENCKLGKGLRVIVEADRLR